MSMFCFQCEQTALGKGCTKHQGVCGKKDHTAHLQDELTGAMIGLARVMEKEEAPNDEVSRLVMKGLFTTVTNVNFNDPTIKKQVEDLHNLQKAIGGEICDFDMQELWSANEDIRSLKSLILFGLRGMAAYAYHADVLGYHNEDVNAFFLTALRAIGGEEDMDTLLALVMDTGNVNLQCMAMLDKANTETYGTPEPTEVSMTIEKGPFIIITGHDLHDLYLLLEQTKDKGINIYTHGEMLPTHAYPKLKAYPHLKGNFGTAWQNQQKEFDGVPAPILYTTNCLMPVKDSYSDRVFTTEVVSYPEMVHIGPDKDFTPVIEKALELGGYPEDHKMTGINGGSVLTTGFARGTVLS
ncbi:MAG: hydroxylamine reductase, partial [Eubacterium callanderi]